LTTRQAIPGVAVLIYLESHFTEGISAVHRNRPWILRTLLSAFFFFKCLGRTSGGNKERNVGFGVERTHIIADRKLGVGGAGERGTGIRREGTEVPEDRAQSIDGGREISVVDSAPGLSGNGPAETTDLRT
jgi:hypothetical protein